MPEVLAWIRAREVFVFVGRDEGRETRSRTYSEAELRAHLRAVPMREVDIERAITVAKLESRFTRPPGQG